jgi:HSP20 family molecular chaperone IbpA
MTEKSAAVQLAPEPTSLKVVEPNAFFDRINRIRKEITRRASEIFESDGRRIGHGMDRWFQAEAEMLHPVGVSITELDDALNIQAEVLGFKPNELKETSKEDKKKGTTISVPRMSLRRSTISSIDQAGSAEAVRIKDM